MADINITSQLPALPPVTPGKDTSEYTITKYVTLSGGVLSLIFGVLTQVQLSGLLPEQSKVAQVIAGILSVVSLLLAVAKAMGYTQGRSAVKVAEQQANAAFAVAAVKTIGSGTAAAVDKVAAQASLPNPPAASPSTGSPATTAPARP